MDIAILDKEAGKGSLKDERAEGRDLASDVDVWRKCSS